MRISLCNEVIAELSFERQCELAARLGYDGIELAPFTLGELPHNLPAARRATLRQAAANAGIAITGLHYLLRTPEGLSITTSDDTRRRRTIDVMRALCAFAADLGARVLVHGSPMQRALDPADETAGRRHGIACFAEIAGTAEANGVVYCIEPLSRDQTEFINTVAEAAEIVRTIGSPAVRTMIDCSSTACTESKSVADLIRQWLPTGLIGHIHFNDPNRQGPGDGALDFAPILAALHECRYPHDAAIEPFIYEPDGPACTARGIAHIRNILKAQDR
ncbi:MAG: sugar phosphate isomerase/epimerase [Rhizobiales bacterium]|nr:sugar phosphate isomerase/epimerase [Hyphomicrobiales bacterium]